MQLRENLSGEEDRQIFDILVNVMRQRKSNMELWRCVGKLEGFLSLLRYLVDSKKTSLNTKLADVIHELQNGHKKKIFTPRKEPKKRPIENERQSGQVPLRKKKFLGDLRPGRAEPAAATLRRNLET